MFDSEYDSDNIMECDPDFESSETDNDVSKS